jgi:hypothetical protein
MKPLINIQQRSGLLALSPNETRRINFTGSYISILTNNTTIDVLVSADSGTSAPVKAGIGFPTVSLSADQSTHVPAVFAYVDFTNPSNSETMTVEYLLSLGQVQDTRTVVTGYLQMDLSAPVLQAMAALTVQTNSLSMLPASALIKERIVQNTGEYPLWWGDANIDPATGRGLVINPGGAAVINCWGAVYFKAEGGASRLSVVNILKVA